MTNKTQNILILIVTVLIISLISVWFFVLNKGSVSITTGLSGYTINVADQAVTCPADPCVIKLEIGNHKLQFTKDGYNSAYLDTIALRGRTTSVQFNPKKLAELKVSEKIPAFETPSMPLPKNIDEKNVVGYKWNADGSKLLYLDSTDGRLKISDTKGVVKQVTTIKNISAPISFYWSADGNKIVAINKTDMYLIQVDVGSRKKQVIDFEPSAIVWSPDGNYFLINKEMAVLRADWGNAQTFQNLGVNFDLSKSFWIDDSTLLTYETNDASEFTNIYKYNPSTKEKEGIVSKNDFPVDIFTYNPAIKTAYFHNEAENNWYELVIEQ